MKKAVAISLNWNTGETRHTLFDGDGCADRAAGWTHFAHWTAAAGDERGERIANEICGRGVLSERVPQ